MMTIGITESDTNFQYYAPFIQGDDPDIEVIILSYKSQNMEELSRCDGIVLSGGVDTHPRFYNHDRIDYPLAQAFNEVRDEWELQVFEYARVHRLPVLAICRGMQIVNIALGGDLIQDLEEQGSDNHRRTAAIDGNHLISLEKGSLLYAITHYTSGMVNSAHHQGLGRLADVLTCSAYAQDHTIEAIEYKDRDHYPFLIGVQWHPERLHVIGGNQQFSINLREAFLNAVHHSICQ